MTAKEKLHRLTDELPEEALAEAARLLEAVVVKDDGRRTHVFRR